ncbi:MAG: Na(+)/H(+) antiporter subunit B [Rhizobiaceae bacterium]|nr:Na(+)/H(+) antiporter subunit B [Hyphomicrobiales bacterium]NRB30234.1 Na(+)/H(+) antiporter subunit B [Rhizobiaceae bacterium]
MDHHLILRVVTQILVAPILLYGLYVQFHGDFGPGGGFQAGVIFAVGFILYGIVFGLRRLRSKFPDHVIHKLVALGVLIYAGTGVVNMALGGNFLDYNVLSPDPVQGQHWGIIAVELGVGVTVFGVMMAIYYAFAGRPPSLDDKDW